MADSNFTVMEAIDKSTLKLQCLASTITCLSIPLIGDHDDAPCAQVMGEALHGAVLNIEEIIDLLSSLSWQQVGVGRTA